MNIPRVVYSLQTSIVQQLVTTKIYNVKKLQKGGEYLMCSFCRAKEETVLQITRSCSAIAQSMFKALHDRILRAVYHSILQTVGLCNQGDQTTPWYKEQQPKGCAENQDVKVLWDIPIYQDVPPRNAAINVNLILQAVSTRYANGC